MAGVVVLALGLGLVMGPPGAGAADTAPPLVTSLQKVVDGVGDIVNGVTGPLFDNGRADITGASLEWAPGWIRMKTQLKTATDPLKDPAWSDADDIEWAFDTNNDGKVDYTVEFATDKGQLYGAVFDATKPDTDSVCDADSASFTPEDGYTLVIDPKCIGNPTSLYWAVTTFVSSNPKDANAQVVSDRVPDQGFTAQSAPGQPAPAPPAPPPAPLAGPPPPSAAGPGGTRGPASVGPKLAAPAPKTAAPAAPGRTASGTAGSSSPTAGAAPGAPASTAPGGGTATAPAPGNLARTGSTSSRDGLFGLGLMLLGFGVVVMTRPNRRAGIPA
jgi:hypothetical protein